MVRNEASASNTQVQNLYDLVIQLITNMPQKITISGWNSSWTIWLRSRYSTTCDDYPYYQYFLDISLPQ